ncbi:MAG: aminopeptidase, partial [Clostridiales bacterium]|nr:aminopeptidase [Clostridiales bacterium]
MIKNFDEYLKKYVRLCIRKGLNVQKGQTVFISAQPEQFNIVRLATEEAYAAGAREVITDWNDEVINRLTYLNADEAVFDEYPDYLKVRGDYLTDIGAARLYILSENPEALAGVDPNRVMRKTKIRRRTLKHFYEATMSNLVQWCIASVPSNAWATKVFAGKEQSDAVDALWEKIFRACRIDENDPLENWDKHIALMKKRASIMNSYNFKTLHYKNSIGTDFTVGLAKNYIFEGGSEDTPAGVTFLANIPTEEIYTAPDRLVAEGKVV